MTMRHFIRSISYVWCGSVGKHSYCSYVLHARGPHVLQDLMLTIIGRLLASRQAAWVCGCTTIVVRGFKKWLLLIISEYFLILLCRCVCVCSASGNGCSWCVGVCADDIASVCVDATGVKYAKITTKTFKVILWRVFRNTFAKREIAKGRYS